MLGQQCWEMLHWDVAIVWPELDSSTHKTIIFSGQIIKTSQKPITRSLLLP